MGDKMGARLPFGTVSPLTNRNVFASIIRTLTIRSINDLCSPYEHPVKK